MSHTIKRLYQSVVVFGLAGFFIVLASVNIYVINTTDFSMYNSGWNGCSSFALETKEKGEFQLTITYDYGTSTIEQKSFISYELDPATSCLFIIGPKTPFSNEEINYVHTFVSNGGRLFLADDFGSGNMLLKGLNTTSRFSRNLVLDLSFEKNASFVALFSFSNVSHPLTENISSILLNYPSSLQLSNNALPLAFSSDMSWLDANLNGKKDENEPRGPFPVLAVEPYGNGSIICFSDPSVLINSMDPYFSNKEFRSQLINFLLQGKQHVIIDESHRDMPVPFQMGYQIISDISPLFKISILLLAVIVFLVLFTSIPKDLVTYLFYVMGLKEKETKRVSISSLVHELSQKHPNWDKTKIQALIERMNRYE